MKKLLALLMSLMMISPTYAQIGGGIFGQTKVPVVVTACSSGCDFTKICNDDPTTWIGAITQDCEADSAMASITDSSITKPYRLDIKPGIYNEILVIKDKTDIEILLAFGTRIISHPALGTTSKADGNGVGTLRIAPSGNTTQVERIIISGWGSFENHVRAGDPNGTSFGGQKFEAACQIGAEDGTGGDAQWTDVYFGGNVRCIGVDEGINIAGTETDDDPDAPRFYAKDLEAIGGHKACNIEGNIAGRWDDGGCTVWTNYCSITSAAQTGNVGDTGNSTTAIHLDGILGADGLLVGRSVTLATAACAAGATRKIGSWTLATEVATTDPNDALPFTPDPNCTYSVSLAPMGEDPPCTDFSWETAEVADESFGALVTDVSGNKTDPGDSSEFMFNGTSFTTYFNTNAKTTGLAMGGVFLTGLIAQDMIFKDISSRVYVNNSPLSSHSICGAVAFGMNTAEGDNGDKLTLSGLLKVDDRVNVAAASTVTLALTGFSSACGASQSGTGDLFLGPLAFDVTGVNSPGGTSNISDFWFEDGNYRSVFAGGFTTSQNGGKLREVAGTVFADPNFSADLPVPRWTSGASSVSSNGSSLPTWSTDSAVWSAGDLICSLAPLPYGTQPLDTVTLNVDTGDPNSSCSVCVYNEAGDVLEMNFGSADPNSAAFIDCSATALPTATMLGTWALSPGNHWICVGSTSTGTLILKGRVAAPVQTGVVGRLATAVAQCPATIAPGDMTSWTTAIPEPWITP